MDALSEVEYTVHMKQCKACPWKKSTVPERDIPGGYSEAKHRALCSTMAPPGEFTGLSREMRMMACHESKPGKERECVGWVAQQLGPGNNIGLRLLARDGRYAKLELDGEQHERLEDTFPKKRKRVARDHCTDCGEHYDDCACD